MEPIFTKPYKCRKHGETDYYLAFDKRINKHSRRCKICGIQQATKNYRRKNPVPEKKSCKMKGCTRKHFAKNFCSVHYSAFAKGSLLEDGTPLTYKPKKARTTCTFGMCQRPEHGSGLCNLHRKWLYKGYIDKNHKILVPEKCRERRSADKCKLCGDTKVKGYGFCQKHYKEFKIGNINEQGGRIHQKGMGPITVEGKLRKRVTAKQTCTVHLCFSRTRISKGLCRKHQGMVKAGLIDNQGNKLRELKKVVSYEGAKCKICPQPARSKGFCRNHWNFWKQGRLTLEGKWLTPPMVSANKGKTCSHEGCTKEAKIKGLCVQHRNWQKTGFVGWKNKGHKCSEYGCEKEAVARTLCDKHYQQLRITERLAEAEQPKTSTNQEFAHLS
jgi:hypothetical protein